MLKYNNKFTTQLKHNGRCLLTLFTLVFVFSVTAFAFTEALQDTMNTERLANATENAVNAKVVRILMSTNDRQARAHGEKDNKFVLVNIEQQNDTEKLLATTIKEQQQQHKYKRDVSNIAANQNNNNQSAIKQGYYEEQRPVVVHAETLPPLGRRQDDFGAPPNAYRDAYYARSGSVYDDEEEEDKSQEGADAYPYEQRPATGYYGGDNDDSNAAGENVDDEADSVGEGRAAGNAAYDSYYRQWHYATPAPIQRPNGGWEVRDNRKLQNGERDPYAAYDADGPMEDYEYPGALTPLQKQQYEQQLLQRQQQQQNKPQHRPQQNAMMQQQQQAVQRADPHNRPSTANNSSPTENTLLSTLKSLKTMWDIYRAFAAAWNSLATHRKQQEQQQQEAAKRRQQQIAQQMRINSKKSPKIGVNDKYTQRNSSSGGSAESSEMTAGVGTNAAKRVKPNNKATKNPKTTTTTTQSTTSIEFVASSEAEQTVANGSDGGNNKNARTKGDAMARQNAQGEREKRQTTDTAVTESSDVGEGRYIKGDPLKGYYDFVITEGSYKFWAVFQTGTALLIIYSTFAAIYYSKVNPLVSDYDYVDYLGGARSLSGGDDDFIDDDNGNESGVKQRRGGWLDAMLPRAGRTIQYILDALDKLPVDHREADAAMRSERARQTSTNGQVAVEDHAMGNAYENENDDAAARNAEADGSEQTPAELETTQRAYAA